MYTTHDYVVADFKWPLMFAQNILERMCKTQDQTDTDFR